MVKIPNFRRNPRTVNSVTIRAETLRLIAVYFNGSRNVSSSTTGATTQAQASSGFGVKLAPRYFFMGKATKIALMMVRDKLYPNK
jgi:hypothetical protein